MESDLGRQIAEIPRELGMSMKRKGLTDNGAGPAMAPKIQIIEIEDVTARPGLEAATGKTHRKMKDSPGMFMKTKGRISPLWAYPGMLYKNKGLRLCIRECI